MYFTVVNYFDSISLYRWSMGSEQVTKFEKNLTNLDWKVMLAIQLFLAFMVSVFSFLLMKNVVSELVNMSSFFVIFTSNLFINLLFLFGSYYFLRLFFRTNLSLTEFYKATIYLYLPVLLGYVLINFSTLALSYVSATHALSASFLYLPLLYYIIKQFNTYIYIFKTEFFTTDWPLVGVLILWAFINNKILSLINSQLLLLI